MEFINVLIVGNKKADLEIIRRYLDRIQTYEFELNHCNTLKQALDSIEKNPPALMMIDQKLSSGKDLNFIRELQNRDQFIPAIMLTNNEVESLTSHTLRHAMDDYINKNCLTSETLKNSINHVFERSQMPFERHLKILELETADKMKLDILTGLHKREVLLERLKSEIMNSSMNRSDESISLMLIDIDKFRRVNDRRGLFTGDILLRKISNLLTLKTRESDLVTRFGGDEFCVMTATSHQIQAAEMARDISQALNESLKDWCQERNLGFQLKASFGVTPCSSNVTNPYKHIERANRVLRSTKSNNETSVSFTGNVISSYMNQFSRAQ